MSFAQWCYPVTHLRLFTMERSSRFLVYPAVIILFCMMLSCNGSGKHSPDGITFRWKLAAKLPAINGIDSSGLAGPVAGIVNGVLLIGGGSNFAGGFPWNGGKKKYYAEVYAYRLLKDSLVNIKAVLNLPYPVAYPANCTTDKGIVVAGGENEGGVVSKVMLIGWNEKAGGLDIRYLPDLPQPLANGAITVDKDKLYFAGGENATSVSRGFYRLDLERPAAGWQSLPPLPDPVSHTVLFAQSDGTEPCIYLAGGRKRNPDSLSEFYNGVYRFDLKEGRWQQEASLPYALSAHTGVALGDHRLFIFSGDQGKTFHATELLLMKIAREKDAGKRAKLVEEKNDLQRNHPGFSGEVLSYDTHTGRWTTAGSIGFPGQVTTTVLKWNDEIIIPCGEIRAGVRTPDIITGKIDRK